MKNNRKQRVEHKLTKYTNSTKFNVFESFFPS